MRREVGPIESSLTHKESGKEVWPTQCYTAGNRGSLNERAGWFPEHSAFPENFPPLTSTSACQGPWFLRCPLYAGAPGGLKSVADCTPFSVLCSLWPIAY